ncbi:MAG: tRNA lysidine(34) synthetase TilS [Labilithrix sp.]|nr:tRNA lysidine(34) synthetase TilS [Labilithrix sp.]
MASECALPAGSAILVAVSGGPDSMALLSVLARVGPALDLTILAHGVDHGLRPEAARELDLAEAFARAKGVPFERTRVAVPRGGNVQARARELRWRALVAAARGRGAAIATAHHADDRAETVLMRLLRGAGARGLGVLPPCAWAPESEREATGPAVRVVRPLLRARRADVLLHVERHEVPFARDPSNEDPRYLRAVVRHDVLPRLAELDPNVVRHLEALADELVNEDPRGKSPEWASSLPRSTQNAIARLATSGSTDARVWLPGGLVVSVDPRARRQARTREAGRDGDPRVAGARARVVSGKPSG